MQWSPPRVSVKWPSSADLNAVLCKRSFETPTACRAEHSQVGVARWPAGTATTTYLRRNVAAQPCREGRSAMDLRCRHRLCVKDA